LGEGASVIRDTLVLNPSEHGNAYSNADIYSHPHTNCHSIAIPDAYPYLHADCHSIATTDAYSHSYSHP
jgi:hypothetical protein